MILDSKNKEIQIKLGGDVTTTELDWEISFKTTIPYGALDGTTDGATLVTMVAGTPYSTPFAENFNQNIPSREIRSINIYNNDSVPQVVYVIYKNGGSSRVLRKINLQVNYTLAYEHGTGWYVMDDDGAIINTEINLTAIAIGDTVIGATPDEILYVDAGGTLQEITLGSGLDLTGGILSVTVGSETLAQTLVLGNATGGNDIILTGADVIESSDGFGSISLDNQVRFDFNNGVATHYIKMGSGVYELVFNSGTVLSNISFADLFTTIQHDAKLVFDAPVYNFAQLTLSTLPYLDAGKNLVSSSISADGNNLFFASNYGIDSVATGGSDVLNIGVTNANVINYGNSSTVHNFLGTAIYELQVNSYVTDKLMTLNYGGAIASGIGVGFEIEENAVITGYFKTNGARTGWSLKAPANTDYTDFILTASVPRTKTFQDTSSTIAEYGNKLSVFAATTSAELAGVISDETGYSVGAVLVFNLAPVLKNPTIVDTADPTKIFAFDLSEMTTAKTLTIISAQTTSKNLTIPNITTNDVIVTNDFIQTLTNKTLTSPAINTPTIIGGTIRSDIFAPQGFLINGKIVPSVASNNLTIAIKTLAGTDATATDPIYIRIGDTVRSITGALSVTKNAGTNWFNSGVDLAALECDYFIYLGYNATDGVVIGFARIAHANQYSDFSVTTTNEKYCAISNITTAAPTDYYELIGRFAATLSAGAGYTWTVPTFTAKNLIQYPINESRRLSWVPIHTRQTTPYTNQPTVNEALYQIRGNTIFFWERHTQNATPGGSGTQNYTTPFTSGMSTYGVGWVMNNSSVVSLSYILTGASNVGRIFKYDATQEVTASQLYMTEGFFTI